jgi:methylmalonyl-CoA mutase
VLPQEVIRSTQEEKDQQINTVAQLQKAYGETAEKWMETLQEAAVSNSNIFEGLMQAAKVCSIGQITAALFEVGGQYRRNM